MLENKPVFAFDLGNVIFGFDYNLALNKLKPRLELPNQEVINILYYKDFTLDFEKGLISAYDFYRKFKTRFCKQLEFSEFKDIWCDIFFPQVKVIDLLKNLKNRFQLHLISNINKLHFQYLYHGHKQVFALFDGLILSYQVKSLKPEEAIYQALAKQANTSLDNIIYIDDRPELVAAAKKLGIKGIQFFDCPQLVKELESQELNLTLQKS